jgi:hypothetical protein
MKNYHSCIKYLTEKKTQSISHQNKSFFDHLVGVYNLLKKVDAPSYVCYAGLFHSIYGNDIFKKQIETDRSVIKNLIGPKAENLVYMFSNIPREKILKNKNKDIKMLLTFNELEQTSLFKVYNDVFSPSTIDKLYFNFRDEKKWQFTGSGVTDTNWRKFKYDLNIKNKFDKVLFKKANEILKLNGLFNYVNLVRAYASASVYGTVNEFHYDEHCSSYNEIYTIMFYLNKTWPLSYGGETVFSDADEKDIFSSVLPQPARAILFDGFIFHGAREPSRICNDLRMIATFKYRVGK